MDLDEFWFGTTGILKDVLGEIPERIHTINCNWTIIGPSEDQLHPKSLRKELLFSSEGYSATKYITRVRNTDSIQLFVHNVETDAPQTQIIENERIKCYHYYCQSLDYWLQIKIPRGYVNTEDIRFNPYISTDLYERYSAPCTLPNTLLRDLLEAKEKTEALNRNADLCEDSHGQDNHTGRGAE